jgi:hypothetical protein
MEKSIMDQESDDFFEEYGEEMTKSFLNFGIHFKEYVCEMNNELCNSAMEYGHSFAKEYGIEVKKENDEFYYSAIENTEETDFVYSIIMIYMRFADKVKEVDHDLWQKAVEYSSDYGGVGRVKFYHSDKEKEEDEKD